MTRWKRKILMGLGVLFLALLIPGMLVFSLTPQSDAVSSVFEKVEKVQQYFIDEKLKGDLSLSDQQVSELKAILKRSNTDRAQVVRRRVELMDSLENGGLTGEALVVAVKELDTLDDRFSDLEKSKRSELKAVLNPEQRAKFELLRRQMVHKVLRVLKPFL